MIQNEADDPYDVPATNDDVVDPPDISPTAVAPLSLVGAVLVAVGWVSAYRFGETTATLFLIDLGANDFATIGYLAKAAILGGFAMAFITSAFIFN